MRTWVSTVSILIACCFALEPAAAQNRSALVIGNSAYKSVPRLTNPENDAAAVGLLLKKAGFDVVDVRQDLTNADMRRAIRDFSEAAKDTDIAVVYFAGHGIEVGGMNYLVPVDSALRRDIDIEDEAISVDRILGLLEPVRKLRLVILDACRDNPFTPTMARTLASRSIGRGLAKIESQNSDTLIAFAAKAGSVALDGQGTNSPFTLALLKHLTTPGLDIRLAFGRIRDDVLATTGKKQEPFVYGALGGATVTLAAPRPEKEGALSSISNPDPDAIAARDYEVASKVGNRQAWEAFLAKYTSGFYAEMARAQRDKQAAINADGNVALKPALHLRKEPESQPTQPGNAMREMAEAMRRLASSGGLVSNPNAPAEFYHNARLLAQRGETDLAIAAYEEMLKFPIIFADAIEDVVVLARRMYGDSASDYVENKLGRLLTGQSYLFAKQVAANEPMVEIEHLINEGKLTYVPLGMAFVDKAGIDGFFSPSSFSQIRYGLKKAAFTVLERVRVDYQKGQAQALYLDGLRAEGITKRVLSLEKISANQRYWSYTRGAHINLNHYAKSSMKTGKIPYAAYLAGKIAILDNDVDLEKEVRICYVDIGLKEHCSDLRKAVAKPTMQTTQWTYFTVQPEKIFVEPSICIFEIWWTDKHGGEHKISVEDIVSVYRADVRERHPNAIAGGDIWYDALKKGSLQNYATDCIEAAQVVMSSRNNVPSRESSR